MTTQTQHDREGWLEERRNYLGASDSPVIVGVSPYTTPYDLWRDKQGLNEPTDKPIMRFGRRMESAVADEYEDVTGRKLARFNKVQYHKQFRFLAANPDRRVIGEKRLVQIKTAVRSYHESEAANAECVVHHQPARVREYHDVQVQHEMGITGAEVNDLAVATAYGDLCIYERPRDPVKIEQIFTIDRAWWERHMVRGEEPPRTGRYLRELRGDDVMLSASEFQIRAARLYTDLGEAIKRLTAKRENVSEELKRSLAGAKKLVDSANGLNIVWTPWQKVVEETDWEHLAESYRRVLVSLWREANSTKGHTPLSAYLSDDLLNQIQMAIEDEADGSLRSVYTNEVTKSGEAWQVRWKDRPQAEEQESTK